MDKIDPTNEAKRLTDKLIADLIEVLQAYFTSTLDAGLFDKGATWLILMRALNAVYLGLNAQFNKACKAFVGTSPRLSIDDNGIARVIPSYGVN